MREMQVKMFGGLNIQWKDTVVVESSSRVNKPLELLILLLLGRDHPFSNEQLTERLWEEDKVENPTGALKNAVYSLRRLLNQKIPDTEFITTVNHRYCWNPDIPLNVDLWQFEDHINRLTKEHKVLPVEERINIGLEAMELYAGDFLPLLSDRQWVLQEANYLRQMYLSAVKQTSELLLKRGRHADLEKVLAECNRAVMVEPLREDLYLCLFRAMQGLDMKTAILNYYPVISNLFFDELGEKMPDKVRDIYNWAAGSSNLPMEDIHNIQKDLDEATREAKPIQGAYCCPYEIFKHMFHMMVRSASREDNSVVLMLLTLSGEHGFTIPKEDLAHTMLKLKSVIQGTLRKGDVFSRYSRCQYILMLSVKDVSDCPVVEKRLRSAFTKNDPPLNVKLTMLSAQPNPIL